MNAANHESYESMAVRPGPGACFKPRLRPLGDGSILVTLPCGATGTIRPLVRKGFSKPAWSVDEIYSYGRLQDFDDIEQALRALAWEKSRLRLVPLFGRSSDSWAALASEVEYMNTVDVCKVLRKLLRERTGRDWSVTRGRGTAASWISIKSPPKRQTKFGGLSVEDQILLTAALGGHAHWQGESIRTERGVRGSYVFRIAGVGIPEDWYIADPSWD